MYTIIGGDGKEYGPVPAAQIRGWIAGGRANLQTKAKFLGTEDWKPLGEFPEFNGSPVEFEPPIVAELAGADAKTIAADLIARAGPLQIMDCYERSWALLKSNFWPLMGVTLLVLFVEAALGSFTTYRPYPDRPYIALNMGTALLSSVLKGGLYFYILKRIRRQSSSVADAFAGFSIAFLPLFLTGIVGSMIIACGFLLLVLPGIYIATAYVFAVPLIVDRKLKFWTAMEVSRRVITAQWWRVFGLLLLAFPLMLLGLLCLVVGVFVAMVLVYGAILYAYEDLCNPQGKS